MSSASGETTHGWYATRNEFL